MKSTDIVRHLENLRLGRNITQTEFIDGVVSSRQYHRYLKGESEIAFQTVEKFSDKLGIATRKLIAQIEQEKFEQSKIINMYYNAVVNRDVKKQTSLSEQLKHKNILDKESRLFYDFANLIRDHQSGVITTETLTEKIKSMINYPDILKRDYLTDIEMLIMSTLIDFLPKKAHTPIIVRLTLYYENKDMIMSGGNDMIHPIILMRLAKAHGLKNDMDKVLELSDIALKRGNYYKQDYLFHMFYYFKSLAYFQKDMKDEFEETLYRCYCALETVDNKARFDKYKKLLEKDFNIDLIKFIGRYIRKKHLK